MAQFLPNNAQPGSYGRSDAGAIDQGLRAYMLRVYNYMALGVAGTAVVVLALMNNPQIMVMTSTGVMRWVLFGAILGLGIFSHKVIFSGNKFLAHGAYWLYCALWGALMAPFIFGFIGRGQGHLVAQAFAITAATFAATSLVGYTTKRDMTGMSGFLSFACIGLLIASLVSFFFITDPGTSKTMSLIISCAVVLLFSVMIAFETQMIKSMYIEASTYGDANAINQSAIFGAFALYGSIVTLFQHILNILGLTSSE
ncbi:MAG: Bax inhibitor-1 family protein [Hyphomicrobiaceae bacterium]